MAIRAYRLGISLATIRSEKARKWIAGRKDWREKLRHLVNPEKDRILVHAASLGEMEQGLPVVQLLRKEYPDHQIIISFNSPSGYEHFEDQENADAIIYLPIDLKAEAIDFAQILKPRMALFIKYEIWPNLIEALKDVNCKLVLAPAVFRPNQIYFKGGKSNWFRQILNRFDQILVQNQYSQELVHKIGIEQVQICGDSRFEKAMANTKEEFRSSLVEDFLVDTPCFMIGSSWPKEEDLALKLLEDIESKLVLAPHDVSPENINRILRLFDSYKASKFSEGIIRENSRVLIIDSIGQLKYLYRYADIALIGGGFGKGVHSTVEAAAYQIPLLFGPNHTKFPETIEMQEKGLAIAIKDFPTLRNAYQKLRQESKGSSFKKQYQSYLDQKQGASKIIFEACKVLIDGSGDQS